MFSCFDMYRLSYVFFHMCIKFLFFKMPLNKEFSVIKKIRHDTDKFVMWNITVLSTYKSLNLWKDFFQIKALSKIIFYNVYLVINSFLNDVFLIFVGTKFVTIFVVLLNAKTADSRHLIGWDQTKVRHILAINRNFWKNKQMKNMHYSFVF